MHSAEQYTLLIWPLKPESNMDNQGSIDSLGHVVSAMVSMK